MKEQERQFERIEHLSVEGEDHEKSLIDLSTAGAAFLYPREIKAGNKVSLKIKDYLVDALVIYCHKRADDGYRVGTRFRNVSAETQKKLETLVDDFSRGATLSYSCIQEMAAEKKL